MPDATLQPEGSLSRQSFDVIVVGVGTMGSATCYQLAKRGLRVLGLEQFDIPHALGAHHGQSRVVRMAYFEHPDYVPLLKRAYENWAGIEADSGQKLLHQVGGIYMGRPDSEAIAGSLKAMRLHDLPHEQLTRDQVLQRYPMFRLPEDFVGLFEPVTGFVVPELAVSAFAEQALRRGAVLRAREPVRYWHADGQGVSVTTDQGSYHAGRIVFCGGAWTSRLVADLGVQLRVTRQVLAWVWPRRPELFAYGRLPVWVIETGQGGQHYGFPMMPDRPGFKLALHKVAEETDPDRVNRDVQPGDEQTFRPLLRDYIPDADGPLLSLATCLYTNSPDSHFIIDVHPQRPNVTIACGFSGHGFKFASVVGEILADYATDGRTNLPAQFLGLRRFGGRG
jgi:sarcosine oxidase